MKNLTGFWRLVRFTLRRDRVRLVVWIVAITILMVVSAASLPEVYPTQKSVDTYVELFGDNPSLIAFAGPGYGFEDPNIGLVLVNETQLNGIIAIAFMSIFLINRHTRAEEDSERAEFIRASVVGRHAPMAAAIAVVATAQVVMGILMAAGFVALDYQAPGSAALAASVTVSGLLFTGIAAVVAQLTNSSRGTLGLGSAVLGIAFVIRAIGDIADNGLSWLSPIGVAQAIRAYADERWWVLGLCVLITVGLIAGAFSLASRRDLGAGLAPPRPGRERAPGWITNALGLAFRLQRASLIGWLLAMFLGGYLFGVIAGDIKEMLAENEVFAEIFARAGAGDVTDAYLGTSLTMLGLMAAGFSVASALRLTTEESGGRAEPILATPTGRLKWSLSHISIAVAGTTAIIAVGGLGAGVAWAPLANDGGQVPRLLAASLVSIPAALVLMGVAVAAFGLAPGVARTAAWSALAVVVTLGFFAEVLQLPGWVMQISPFEHVPAVPAEELTVLPLVVLIALAATLTALGLWSFSRRDLRTE